MRALAFAAAIAGSACLRTPAYHCTTSSECGSNGTCDQGFCSFPDTGCTEGRRYGELAGSLSGQCIAATNDAGVTCPPGGNPGDADCDTIPDSVDNCPAKYNPDQANEDGDKFGDACDPCPPIADDNPPDTDKDGIADACDPNPNTPGDQLFLFEGFHAGVPAGWDKLGTWTAMNDDVQVASPAGHAYLAVAGPTTGHETVTTSMTVVAIPATGTRDIGVIDEHKPGGDSSISCEIFDTNATGSGIINTATATVLTSMPYEMTVGQTYTLKLKRDLGMYACTATRGSATVTTMTTSNLSNMPSDVGLRLVSATASYHWLMVVSSP